MGNPTLQDLPEKDTWETPDWLTDGIAEAIGGFDLDPCAGPQTRVAAHNWSIQRGEDGLKREWFGDVWVNPPFSEKEMWIERAITEQTHRDAVDRVFVLTPDSTDVKSWFHGQLVPMADYIWFGEGRVSFIDPAEDEQVGRPSFGTAISVFGEIEPSLREWFHDQGWLARDAQQQPKDGQPFGVTD